MPEDLPPLPDDAALLICLDAAAALHGIPVDPAWRGEILANLRTIGNAARLVQSFPLEDEAEPAPVFRT
ncbi:DUF4089 domain-containing protein [Roseomonas chloroacetimidivorans]|jgi:hypothetical protein|uniref:DUF4089 domain-containing protein n=1 Tax=Roseomonas chloroacetimidivorans TaxID=1766656 RepID=UPI003C70D08A